MEEEREQDEEEPDKNEVSMAKEEESMSNSSIMGKAVNPSVQASNATEEKNN